MYGYTNTAFFGCYTTIDMKTLASYGDFTCPPPQWPDETPHRSQHQLYRVIIMTAVLRHTNRHTYSNQPHKYRTKWLRGKAYLGANLTLAVWLFASERQRTLYSMFMSGGLIIIPTPPGLRPYSLQSIVSSQQTICSQGRHSDIHAPGAPAPPHATPAATEGFWQKPWLELQALLPLQPWD